MLQALIFSAEKRHTKTLRTANYNCAYVSIMAVLIIFPVILQTVINLKMLPIGFLSYMLSCLNPGYYTQHSNVTIITYNQKRKLH